MFESIARWSIRFRWLVLALWIVTLLPPVLSLVLAGPLIAQASKAGMPISPVTQQLLAVLLVGAGTDYGLFLLFIFAMALGEDYNILVMSRIREEAHHAALDVALTRAIGLTGGTITAAGVILGGTFTVLAIAGNTDQARQLSFTIAFAVFLDTFFVRTLLVPSIAMLLGRWNWWPSTLSSPPRAIPGPQPGRRPESQPEPAADGM